MKSLNVLIWITIAAAAALVPSSLASPPMIPGEMPSCLRTPTATAEHSTNSASKGYFQRGRDYFFATDFDNSIKEFTKAIELKPDATEYIARGFVRRWGRSDTKGAIADYTEAIKLSPDCAEAYFWRGETERDSSGYGSEGYLRALADFSKAIEHKPDYLEAFRRRSMVKQGLKDTKGSLEDLSETIRLAPDARRYVERATVRDKSGDNKGAIDDYTQAIQLNPTWAYDVFFARARLRARMHDDKGAVEDYSRVLELAPSAGTTSDTNETRALAYDERATARAVLGDKSGAQQDRAKAKGLRSNKAPVMPH